MTARYVPACGQARTRTLTVCLSRPYVHDRPSAALLVTFDARSQGQLASVIYEWGDVKYLGKETSRDGDLPVSTRSLSAVHTLNVHYIAEDLCLHIQR